jgi:4-carboxymuconolactone decarboxylase
VSEVREVAIALAMEYCYGAVWARPGLDPRSRSLVTRGVLNADGKFDYVAVQLGQPTTMV